MWSVELHSLGVFVSCCHECHLVVVVVVVFFTFCRFPSLVKIGGGSESSSFNGGDCGC